MAKFKITVNEWKLMKEIAAKASPELPSANHVKLDCRLHCLEGDEDGDTHINGAMISDLTYPHLYGDLALADYGPNFTRQFRNGIQLTLDGRGYFDFYVYNRYPTTGGDLLGNLMLYIEDHKIKLIDTRIWHDVSWTPDHGVIFKAADFV